MIQVTDAVAIDENEIREEFIRASGPGGQNVNRVATAVKLRFDVANSPSLSEDVRGRLLRLGGKRITKDGILVIDARRFRTQEQNRKDAVARLIELVRKAAAKPASRRKTKPSSASKHRRLKEKRRRGQIKGTRRPVESDENHL
jgi:ribosome-associated protein